MPMALVDLSCSLSAVKSSEEAFGVGGGPATVGAVGGAGFAGDAAFGAVGGAGFAGAAAFGAVEGGGVGFAGDAAFGAAGGGDAGSAGAGGSGAGGSALGGAGWLVTAGGDAGAGAAGVDIGGGAEAGSDTGVGCGVTGGFRAHPAANRITSKTTLTTRTSGSPPCDFAESECARSMPAKEASAL